MDVFIVIVSICIWWLFIGFMILGSAWNGLNKHKFEIASAIVLFWPLLVIFCVVALIFSIIIGAFEGLYYILSGFIKEVLKHD